MGVYRTDYIIQGWKLPWKIEGVDFYDDKYLPYIEGHPGIDYILITDGMNGEYNVFGKVISKSEDHGWEFRKLPNMHHRIGYHLTEKYQELFNREPDREPYTFIFSHFS